MCSAETRNNIYKYKSTITKEAGSLHFYAANGHRACLSVITKTNGCVSMCVYVCVCLVQISECIAFCAGTNVTRRLSTCHQSRTHHTNAVHVSPVTNKSYQWNTVHSKGGAVIGHAFWGTRRLAPILWQIMTSEINYKVICVATRSVTHNA